MPTLTYRSDDSRAQRLQAELAFALSRTDRAAMKAWGGRAGRRMVHLAARRVGGLAGLAALAGRAGKWEATGLYRAAIERRLIAHLGDRGVSARDGAVRLGREGRRLAASFVRALRENPGENAPKMLGALLGLAAGSGGPDANGGLPDLDLLFGIGAHRSAFTHTLVIGILAEGLILALADLAGVVHERLPFDRDPLWDRLARAGAPLAQGLATGTVAGLAWHLLADAFVQPGALHGLPVDGLPMEAHEAMIGASGAAEAVRAHQHLARKKRPGKLAEHWRRWFRR